MCRKLILFGCFVLMLGLVGASATQGGVLDIKVAADSDDAEEHLNNGSIELTSSDLEFIYVGAVASGDQQLVGIRFTNVQIPKGEVITRAYVRLDADAITDAFHVGDARMIIQGQLDPNPGTFEATAKNISARARTVAQVPWSPSRWTLRTHEKWWTTDIASIIQEIVNQDGWVAGNAVVLIFSQDPSNPSAGIRESESFNGAGTNAHQIPTLHVEFGQAYAPDEIYREAEAADVLGASWRLYDNPAAFSGKHIGSNDGDGDDNNAAPGAVWVAAYNFEAVGGVYKVLLRAIEPGGDSFWVRITGATSQTYENPAQVGTGWVKFNSMEVAGAWTWDEVHSDDNSKDIVYWELPAGPHTIEIAKREDGTLLDSLIVTNVLTLEEGKLPGAGASGLDMRVSSGADDFEQRVEDGTMDAGSTDLEIPYENAGTPATREQVIGVRFTGALINQNGPIAGAYVEFEMDSVSKAGSNEPVNLIIEGELTPNAAAFVEVAGDITSRLATAAKVKWSIPAGLAVNDKIRSPDISRIIREIVSLDGWGPGNALVLIVRDDKDNPSTGLRETEAYEGEASAAPLLHLATLVPLAKDPNPANGATGAAFAPAVGTYFSSDVPKPVADRNFIPPGTTVLGEAVSTLSVPDSFKVKDLNVELDITVSGQNADYNVYLKDPGGKEVELFTDVGAGSGFTNTILDDEASTTIGGKRDPFTGRFKPESSLSGFDGRNAQGTWQLKIIDDWYGSSATLNSWRLAIEKPLLVSWTPPGGAASQKVYFANNFEDVNSSAASALTSLAIDVPSFDVGVLALGQTYYWRVDGIAADGKVQSRGDIWSFNTAVGNIVTNQRITNGADDVEERLRPDRNGALDVTSSDLEFPYEDEPKDDLQRVGLRFVGVAIPKGAQIVKSYVEFEVDENRGATIPANVIIDAQLTPDAEPFVNTFMNVSQRTFTTTVVPWSVQNWTAVDVKWQTPDISVLLQEIVNLDGWVPGNALVLTIQDDPANPSAGSRVAESVEGEAANAPRLLIAAITEAASAPSPANGAVNVPLNTVLSWTAGLSAIWRNVYFGTSSSPKLLDMTTGRSSAPKLEPSTTYYWKVEEVEANGTKHAGTVWSFTTPPGEATAPSPADFEAGVALDATLSWTAGVTAVSHDVYFGTISPPPFIRNQTVATFDPNVVDPNGLALGAVYYWRIDEKDAQGKKYIGNVWMFKAKRAGTGTILREVWENIGSGTAVKDLTGNSAYPSSPTFSDQRTLFETPTNFADNFGSRVHGYLHPDTSGEYTFWIATDDNSELWLSTDDRPANAVLISKVTNWADPRQWDDPDVIPSGPIHLEGGKKYYISALYKEGGGGDNCSVAWKGPDSPTRAVISGYFLSPFVALWAESPDPAVGTVLQQKFALLGWRAGVTAASHNVYISSNRDDVAGGAPAAFAGNYTTTTLSVGLPGVPVPDGLVPGSTYYWRVDEVEANPTVVHEGAIWSFSVLPAKAHNPNPADGATGVATNKQLSWTPGLAAKLHSVYFGDNRDTVANAVGAPPLPLTTKNPGPLQPGKTYYWRVDELNPPASVKGDVWSFTTAP